MAPHDPEAKVYRKAQSAPAKRHYLGQVPMKHRIGPSIDVEVSVRASLTVGCYELLRVARWTAPPPLLRCGLRDGTMQPMNLKNGSLNEGTPRETSGTA